MCDALQVNFAHQPTKRDADRFMVGRLAVLALAKDESVLVRVPDELGL